MAIVLSHISALEYWRSARRSPRRLVAAPHARKLTSKVPVHDFGQTNGPFWISRPLHVLVGNSSLRRPSKKTVCHVWGGPLPKGYILDAGNGFYVVSPEYSFALMAETMDLAELIELGFEFCGTYDVSDGEIHSCQPLTSLSRLEDFISHAGAFRGSKKALRALSHISANSASPMETILTMLLCLPYRLGGYGLPLPLLNHRIDPGKKGFILSGYYVCDLYWPQARLAVEYDSDSFHANRDSLSRDSIRRGDLASLGITVLSVTRQQVVNVLEMHKLACTFAKHLGKRLCYKEPDFSKARDSLRKTLLGARRF